MKLIRLTTYVGVFVCLFLFVGVTSVIADQTSDCSAFAGACENKLNQCKDYNHSDYPIDFQEVANKCLADKNYYGALSTCGLPGGYTLGGNFQIGFCKQYGDSPGLEEYVIKNLLLKLSGSACELLYDRYMDKCYNALSLHSNYDVKMDKTAFINNVCLKAKGTTFQNLRTSASYGDKYNQSKCSDTTGTLAASGVLKAKTSASSKVPKTEMDKCVKEMISCSELFKACKKSSGIDAANIQVQCETMILGLPSQKWDDQLGVGLCQKMMGANEATYKECQAYEKEVEKLKGGCQCPGKKDVTPVDETESKEDQLTACCQKCKTKTVKLKLEGKKCDLAACADGKVPKGMTVTSNDTVMKKQLCKLCKGGEVIVKGAKEACTKSYTVSNIKAYPDPLAASGIDSPQTFIANLIKTFLGIIGSIALALVVYGGFIWMTSAGQTERVETGRKTVMWAAIGLAAVFSSYVIVAFIFKALG